MSGVALDLVGAAVLSHAHNADSIAELRDEAGDGGSAVGEPDMIATHAQLLAEKRIGFLILTVGLTLYLCGTVLKSKEDTLLMALIGAGVVVGGFVVASAFTHVVGHKIHEQARRADRKNDPDELPEQ